MPMRTLLLTWRLISHADPLDLQDKLEIDFKSETMLGKDISHTFGCDLNFLVRHVSLPHSWRGKAEGKLDQ
jgi:hypothetical protein